MEEPNLSFPVVLLCSSKPSLPSTGLLAANINMDQGNLAVLTLVNS